MGSSSTPAPEQITAANQISGLNDQNATIDAMEQTQQPQMAALGNVVQLNNAKAQGNYLTNINSHNTAGNLAGSQDTEAINLQQSLGQRASDSITSSNPWLTQMANQGTAAFAQGQNTAAQAGNATNQAAYSINQGAGIFNSGQGMITNGYQYLGAGSNQERNALDGNFVNNSNPTLAALNNTVNSELKTGGNVTQQEMNNVDQTTGSAFAANGLFNSNMAAGADLLNRDQFSQNRLQQWTTLGQGVQSLNNATQQNLLSGASTMMNAGTAMQGAGVSEQGVGVSANSAAASLQSSAAQMQNAAGSQMSQGINATNSAQQMLEGGIQSLVNPNQVNTNISSLMSGYNTSNVTPQYTNSLLGTTSSINSTNAQGQFAANSANTASKNAANQANTQMAAAGAVSAATIASSFA